MTSPQAKHACQRDIPVSLIDEQAISLWTPARAHGPNAPPPPGAPPNSNIHVVRFVLVYPSVVSRLIPRPDMVSLRLVYFAPT
jgi:hypothetical protein